MMLVLDRKPGETLCIGNDIRLTIVSIEGGRGTFGIDAPRELLVLRGELLDRCDVPLIVETVGAVPPPCSIQRIER